MAEQSIYKTPVLSKSVPQLMDYVTCGQTDGHDKANRCFYFFSLFLETHKS
jgi:hypothetical protein